MSVNEKYFGEGYGPMPEGDEEDNIRKVTYDLRRASEMLPTQEPYEEDDDEDREDDDEEEEAGPEQDPDGNNLEQYDVIGVGRPTYSQVRAKARALLDCGKKNCGKCLLCRADAEEEEDHSVDLRRYFARCGVESVERQIAMCRTYANYLSQQTRAKQPVIKRIRK